VRELPKLSRFIPTGFVAAPVLNTTALAFSDPAWAPGE
jgi:hypothetical protein